MAITREELENMIENSEAVWVIDCNSFGEKFVREFDPNRNDINNYNPKYMFKTKDDAQWILDMHATREERFEPKTWKEIQQWFKADKHRQEYEFEYSDAKHKIKIIRITKQYIYTEERGGSFCWISGHRTQAIKENYEKAVSIARKLFLGESIDA